MALAPQFSDPPSSISDRSPRPLKNAWSQVVRGDMESLHQSDEAPHQPQESSTPLDLGQERQHEKQQQTPELDDEGTSTEARVSKVGLSTGTPTEAGTPAEARILISNIPETEVKPVGDSKAIWQKPIPDSGSSTEIQPVMGAVAWPALAEARNVKVSEIKKPKESCSKISSSPVSVQESDSGILTCTNDGSKGQPSKSVTKHSGSVKPALPSVAGPHQSPKYSSSVRVKSGVPAAPSVLDHQRVLNNRSDGSRQFTNNTRKWQNNSRDHTRGNHGWHQHGQVYGNTGDMPILLHEQRIGPRNMPRSHPSFMNFNPGFYHAPNFQNGGMYYLPSVVPDFVPGAPYFYPVAPPVGAVGAMPGPDPVVLRSMLLKQIEYYFSVENLCKDVYLRSNMDNQGFVPISLIACFNRVKKLSSNPIMILEALQQSSVVEIQDDKIRRRDDWKKWVLPSSESGAATSTQERKNSFKNRDDSHKKQETSNAANLDVHGARQSTEDEYPRRHSDSESSAGSMENKQAKNGYGASDDAGVLTNASSQHLDSKTELGAHDRSQGLVCRLSEHGYHGSLTSSTLGLETVSRKDATLQANHDSLNAFERSYMPVKMKENVCEQSKSKDLKDGSFYLQNNMDPNGSLHSDSLFSFRSHEKNPEDRMEVNDKDVQRLINVTHAQLGSFIAVP